MFVLAEVSKLMIHAVRSTGLRLVLFLPLILLFFLSILVIIFDALLVMKRLVLVVLIVPRTVSRVFVLLSASII
jgi:hypothetical protein